MLSGFILRSRYQKPDAEETKPDNSLQTGSLQAKKRKAEKVEIKELLTFEKVARDWHSSNRTWSENHRTTVLSSLESHLFPIIGNRNITELKTRDLLVPLKRAEAMGRLELVSVITVKTCSRL